MLLSDDDIQIAVSTGRILIEPLDAQDIQPSSVDVHLSRQFRVFDYPIVSDRPVMNRTVDPRDPPSDLTELAETSTFILEPGEFVLGSTIERVGLATDLVARLEGRSSLGRLGLMIHSTAGYIDPGWEGTVTLEMSNVGPLNLVLTAGMRIGQLSFHQLSSPARRPYGSYGLGSKYQGQDGPVAARSELR